MPCLNSSLRRSLCLVGSILALLLSSNKIALSSVGQNDVYITETGTGTGASCTDALSVSWLNDAAHWGSAVGLIGPGTVLHLCGKISVPLVIQGSGVEGNVITVLFEPGARLSAASWQGTALSVLSSYVVIDGGRDGVIEATDQGSDLGVHVGSGGIGVTNASHVEIKNLTVRGMYVHTPNSPDTCDNSGGDRCGNAIGLNLSNSTDISIHHNVLVDAFNGVSINYGPNNTKLSIYSNKISRTHWGIGGGDWPPNGSTLSDVDIYDNSITDAYVWVDPADVFHLNGIYIWAEQTGDRLSNVRIHGNTIGGNMGLPSHITAFTWFSGHVYAPMLVYDNLYYSTSGLGSASNGFVALGCNSTTPCGIYGNTFYSSTPAGLGVRAADGVDIKDNIFSGVVSHVIYAGDPGNNFSITSDYNLFYGLADNQFKRNGLYYTSSTWQAQGLDVHSKFSDPQFVDPLALNFHLQPTSPAVDSGVSLDAMFNSDRDGYARPYGSGWDMGAYEFGASNAPKPQPSTQPTPAPTSDGSATSAITTLERFINPLDFKMQPAVFPYSLKAPAHVKLSVLTRGGEEVAVLVDADQAAGSHTAQWNGRNTKNKPVASGMYMLVFQADSARQVKKILVAR